MNQQLQIVPVIVALVLRPPNQIPRRRKLLGRTTPEHFELNAARQKALVRTQPERIRRESQVIDPVDDDRRLREKFFRCDPREQITRRDPVGRFPVSSRLGLDLGDES